MHLLAALTGHGINQYEEIQRPKLRTDGTPAMPSAVPVDLLARRPDVLASRLRVASARAGLAAARADFYPNIDLSAFAGTQAIGLDNLFHGPAGVFGVGPALHLPVFDAGRLRAKYRANTADIDIAMTAYNQAVLTMGARIEAPAAFVTRLNDLLVTLTEQTDGVTDPEPQEAAPEA